ncbi:hypothetical protein Poli38472_008880 [Pythium oligandrum]|uniref:Tectonic domain-containing protein n=1 Tax=Pythium oligandrum TaxID=41045 RepID=A0A8K1C514_PYTOL|nr:hypothetical protein Poli38472_008880 [Pythium oligandrum]|eukprot:TMW56232.1 hypothetical protein Poli38472_008880 [Pythium oligandrum]
MRRLGCVTLAYPALSTIVLHTHASYAPVNWSLVSRDAIVDAQKALTAPIGCSCVANSGSSSCSFFECACTCDLTAGACDPFCCCDPECTSEHVETVKRLGLCVDTDPIAPSIEYCSADLTLSALSKSVDPLVAGSVLCVAVDNNEVVGDYITPAEEADMTAANAFLKNPKPYSFLMTSETSESVVTMAKTAYEVGDSVRVFARSSQQTIAAPVLVGQGISIDSNACAGLNPVRFLIDWEPSSCFQQIDDLETACKTAGSVLDPASVAANLWIAQNPSVSSASQTSRLVAIEVQLQQRELETQTTTILSIPYRAYYPSPQFMTDGTTATCQGALLGVEYTIYHNGKGHIERATALLTIGNVSLDGANTKTPFTTEQSFRTTFQSTATITRSLEKGNLVSYDRSGNPGYLLHHPVRVGVMATSTESASQGVKVVSEMASGLSLPGLGDCNEILSLGSSLPVLFGEDMQVTCTLSLTASDFRSLCERNTPLLEVLRLNFTHAASFGNSDPMLIDEWLEIEYDAPTKRSSSFVDATDAGTVDLRCEGLLTTLHLEFLVAPVGPVNNPQNKILAARASHASETWTFWKRAGNAKKTQTYLITSTVTFVDVKTQELDQWIPPTPPLWFSIPNDIFYPFLLNGAMRVAQEGIPQLVLVCLSFLVVI